MPEPYPHFLHAFHDDLAYPDDDDAPSPLSASSTHSMPLPLPSPSASYLPAPSYTFPAHPDGTSSASGPDRHSPTSLAKFPIAHPYARLYAKKDGTKRRKIWNHVLEKSLFTPQELSTVGAPQRRTIYLASLEAHVDSLHNQLLSLGLYPVPFEKLEPYRGLNSKTAKSMVSGLQHDATHTKLKLLELERSNNHLRNMLAACEAGLRQRQEGIHEGEPRRHSFDVAMTGSGVNASGSMCALAMQGYR